MNYRLNSTTQSTTAKGTVPAEICQALGLPPDSTSIEDAVASIMAMKPASSLAPEEKLSALELRKLTEKARANGVSLSNTIANYRAIKASRHALRYR